MRRRGGWSALGALLLGCGGSAATADGGPGGDGAGNDSAAGGDGAAGNDAAGDGAGAGDTEPTLPWEGGPDYYKPWKNGPPADPTFFPIAVWLQSPARAAEYKAIGINTFIGLWMGPTDAQLGDLGKAGMPVLCEQAVDYASHLADKTILAWTHQDEPDNAQPDGMGGYGPCIPASTIVTEYGAFKSKDATRPTYLNLGQGVANDAWVGRGAVCAGTKDYPDYIKGTDIVSFDIYPANDPDPAVHDKIWLVALGVDRLRQWADYKKPVWNWIECTGIDGPAGKPTPVQVKAEVWMSLVHGSMGIGYFVHVFKPSFIEAGLLADATMRDAVKAINQQVKDLAPVLNTPSLKDAVTVTGAGGTTIDVMVKRLAGVTYLFAVNMRPTATAAGDPAVFKLARGGGGSAEVLGESRSVPVTAGAFGDAFAAHAVHIYKIP